MLRPQCSYWVTIKPRNGLTDSQRTAAINQAVQFLNNSEILDFMDLEQEDNEICLSVKDGSIEQTSDVSDILPELSKTAFDCIIEYQENNEEPFSPDIEQIFAGGQLMSESYGRRIAPGELDNETINACIQAICTCTDVQQAIKELLGLKSK